MLWGERLSGREAPVAATIGARRRPRLGAAGPAPGLAEAVGRLRGAGRGAAGRQDHHLHLEPQLRPAELAARRLGDRARARPRRRCTSRRPTWRTSTVASGARTRACSATARTREFSPRHPNWTQTIHVTVKGLKSRQFLVAGTTTLVDHSSKDVAQATPGTFQASGKPLRRGDSYDALVYVPTPSTVELQSAGTDYPYYVIRQLGHAAAGAAGARTRPGALRAVGERRRRAWRARPAASRSSSPARRWPTRPTPASTRWPSSCAARRPTPMTTCAR